MSDLVWVRHPEKVWVKAQLLEDNSTRARRLCDGEHVDILQDNYLLCHEEAANSATITASGCRDMTQLPHIHEASILNNLYLRYNRKQCSTFIGNVLVSMNPITNIKEPVERLGTSQVLQQEPHPFGVAEIAFHNMQRTSKSQGIVISGESGSGKTEATKRVLRHLVARSGQSCHVDEELLSASPILESFGNAATTTNDNSSRFGKFINLYFAENAQFKFASIETYLLERSRITCYNNERSFHIFYQLLDGADTTMKRRLLLEDYRGPLLAQVKPKNDAEKFHSLMGAMKTFGMNTLEVLRIVSAIMYLRDIDFTSKDSAQGDIAVITTPGCIDNSANLLGVDPHVLTRVICERTMTLRGETMVSHRTKDGASQARNALAKSIYQRLFDWLVTQVNTGICSQSSTSNNTYSFVGILDIFGFERFEKNSFEQLLINFANEALQTTFNKHVFDAELSLFKEEGLDVSGVAPPASTCLHCLDLFRGKPGLLASIDAISIGCEPSDIKLVRHLHRTFNSSECFLSPHPRLADSMFIVNHYAGPVSYHIQGFVEKNVDSLPKEAETIFQVSSNEIMVQLKPPKAKKRVSITSKFEQQMQRLVSVLNQTSCCFIRCIKPNQHLCPRQGFDHSYVARQLECLSIPQTAQLLRTGLPGRIRYEKLLDAFRVMSETIPHVGMYRPIINVLLRDGLGILDNYKLGKTMAFFTSGTLALVDKRLKQATTSPDLTAKVEMASCAYAVKRILIHVGAVVRFSKLLKGRKKRKQRLALLLQSLYRQYTARKSFQLQRSLIIRIQQLWLRRRNARCTAAIIIQSQVRGYSLRFPYRRLVRSVIALQKSWFAKGNFYTYTSCSENEHSDNATICTETDVEEESANELVVKVNDDTVTYEEVFVEESSSPSDLALIWESSQIILCDDSDETELLRLIDIESKKSSKQSLKNAGFDDEEDGYCADNDEISDETSNCTFNYVQTAADSSSKSTSTSGQATRPRVKRRRSLNHSNEELTNILLNMDSFDGNHEEEKSQQSRSREPSIADIIEAYNDSLNQTGIAKQLSQSSQGSSKRRTKLIRLPSILFRQNSKERKIVNKLRTAIKKKHYHLLIQTLVKAREIELTSPEVAQAELMILRLKTIHAQQLLREAMVKGTQTCLQEAIDNAKQFGLYDQTILKQAIEMQEELTRRNASSRRIAVGPQPTSSA